MRIVSLLPAATEIVCALGLRGSLVGRSHECDFPEDVKALPALTRARIDPSLPSARLDEEVRRIMAARLPIYMLDEVLLAALAPDVVVTQAACEVCAISYDQVVASLRHAERSLSRVGRKARVVSLQPTSLADVIDDVKTVADACHAHERGRAVALELEGRLERVAMSSPGARPRVAVVEWLSPPMLAGHWVPDAIVASGGVPVGPSPGAPSPYTTWDEIRSLAPDAVVVAPCGFDLRRTAREAASVAGRLRALAPRVLLMNGNAYVNRPGPRLVEAIETIAAWLRGGPVPEGRGAPLERAVTAAAPSRA